MSTSSSSANHWRRHIRLRQCIGVLAAGGVIAYPTEAVWGLGCDPANPLAVAQLLRLKQRPVDKGLILVAADMQQFDFLLDDLNEVAKQALRCTWPGHVTWLVPHLGRVPQYIHGKHDTVALRVSKHPVVAALCREFAGPIVSSSANPSARRPALTHTDVQRYFKHERLCIAPGQTGQLARPSVIKNLMTGETIRA